MLVTYYSRTSECPTTITVTGLLSAKISVPFTIGGSLERDKYDCVYCEYLRTLHVKYCKQYNTYGERI